VAHDVVDVDTDLLRVVQGVGQRRGLQRDLADLEIRKMGKGDGKGCVGNEKTMWRRSLLQEGGLQGACRNLLGQCLRVRVNLNSINLDVVDVIGNRGCLWHLVTFLLRRGAK
jgi:hypothetical protein